MKTIILSALVAFTMCSKLSYNYNGYYSKPIPRKKIFMLELSKNPFDYHRRDNLIIGPNKVERGTNNILYGRGNFIKDGDDN